MDAQAIQDNLKNRHIKENKLKDINFTKTSDEDGKNNGKPTCILPVKKDIIKAKAIIKKCLGKINSAIKGTIFVAVNTFKKKKIPKMSRKNDMVS